MAWLSRLLHLGGRRAPDEHSRFVVEAVEGDGMGEAPGHHRAEQGEADRVEVGGGDVPAVEGAAVAAPALAPPRAGQLRAEAFGHPLGLLVGVGLDAATVGSDGDEVRLGAVVRPAARSARRHLWPSSSLRSASTTFVSSTPSNSPSEVQPLSAAGHPCARPSPSSRAAARSRCRARTRRRRWIRTCWPGPLPRDASALAAGAQCSRRSLRSSWVSNAFLTDVVAVAMAGLPPVIPRRAPRTTSSPRDTTSARGERALGRLMARRVDGAILVRWAPLQMTRTLRCASTSGASAPCWATRSSARRDPTCSSSSRPSARSPGPTRRRPTSCSATSTSRPRPAWCAPSTRTSTWPTSSSRCTVAGSCSGAGPRTAAGCGAPLASSPSAPCRSTSWSGWPASSRCGRCSRPIPPRRPVGRR